MELTLLGSGDATGVPAPLCCCDFCCESERRRKPGALVFTDEVTLLFDIGPDITDQLSDANVCAIDAAFLTHAHGDHSAGLPALNQTAKWDADHLAASQDLDTTSTDFEPAYSIYMTPTARDRLADQYGDDPWPRLDVRPISNDAVIEIGDTRVQALPLDHHRPRLDTVGFLVTSNGATAAYLPDMRRLEGSPPDTDIDLLVCEGAAVLGQPVHGPRSTLVDAIDSLEAESVVLVNVNEHLQRKHTRELREIAAAEGYEIGRDLETYAVG